MTGQHAMTCPLCQGILKEVIRENIAIDMCERCRGIWLDRGELEKLMAVARQEVLDQAPRVAPRASYEKERYESGYREEPRRYEADPHYRSPDYRSSGYKKKSKFESIFDIFD